MKFWRFGLNIGRLILRLKFRWFDLWIGAYYDREHGIWYLILIPTLVLEVQWLPRGIIQMDFKQAELRMFGRLTNGR